VRALRRAATEPGAPLGDLNGRPGISARRLLSIRQDID
jgi:hypothetical protein